MKAIKKLTAVLLSVMMLLGLVVIIPASAEDTVLVEKKISLFDLSNVAVGATCTGDVNALPDGVDDAGISRYNFKLWGQDNQLTFHDGTQEVVEVDGEKYLKVYFDKKSGQKNNLYGASGVYSIKMSVPAGLESYVTAVSLNLGRYTVGDLQYRFGVLSGDTCGTTYIYPYISTGGHATANVSDMKEYTGITQATNSGTSAGAWDITTNPVNEVYFLMTDLGATEDGMTGYALIKDISIVVEAPQSVLDNVPITKKINLLDGLYAGESNSVVYPANVSEKQIGYASDIALYTGSKIGTNAAGKEVVELDLNDFGIKDGGTTNDVLNQYNQAYMLQLMNIPAKFVACIDKINLKVKKSADSKARVVYEFGVTDGTRSGYSKVLKANNQVIDEDTNSAKISLDPNTLLKAANWNVCQTSPLGAAWGDTFTGLFLMLSARTADGETAGTLQIEEISITCSTTKEIWETLPVSKKFDLVDTLTADADGNVVYPEGVFEDDLNATALFDGTKKIVDANGEKALRLDLATGSFGGNDSNAFFSTAFTQVYLIKLTNIPAEHISLIQNITLKMNKSADSNAKILYEFGVTDGGDNISGHSKNSVYTVDSATTGAIVKSLVPTDTMKMPEWVLKYTNGNGSYSNWDNSYTGLFLAVAAYVPADTEAGTLDITEISYTCSATSAEWKELATSNLKTYGASLTLQNDITSNVEIDKDTFEANGFSNPYMTFEFEGKTTTINNPTVETLDGTNYYTFAFEKVAPHKMMTNIKATLYATYNGEVIKGEEKNYNAAQYCYTVLDQSDDEALKTLAVDILNYAAAAQTHMGNNDTLANAALTDDQKLLASKEPEAYNSVTNTKHAEIDTPSVYWRAATLEMTKDIKMMFLIQAEDITGLSVKATTDANTSGWTINSSEFVEYAEGFYLVYFDGLDVSQMSETVYLTVNNAEGAVSDTLSYSIESYVTAKKDGGNTLAELVKAMFKYGNSAKAYQP